MRIKIIFVLLAGSLTLMGCRAKQSSESEKQFQERVRQASANGTSAAYFLYENKLAVADTLISLQSGVSDLTQVHESYEAEDGMMGMREIETVIASPGEILRFQQGGLHVMLIGVQKDLKEGDSVLVELKWKQAGVFSKKLPVQAN